MSIHIELGVTTVVTQALRPATTADAPGIARLLPDLGYAGTTKDIERRLRRLDEWPDQVVFVVTRDDEVVGLCHLQGVPLVASDGYAEVQALVVAQSHQRQGVGAALLNQAVAWSRSHGYVRTRLRSGLHRIESHLFYESQGFVKSKASFAFECTHAGSDANPSAKRNAAGPASPLFGE